MSQRITLLFLFLLKLTNLDIGIKGIRDIENDNKHASPTYNPYNIVKS